MWMTEGPTRLGMVTHAPLHSSTKQSMLSFTTTVSNHLLSTLVGLANAAMDERRSWLTTSDDDHQEETLF
jgi:hypothetical protein